MKSVIDDRGYNQGWAENKATLVRAKRRSDQMIREMDASPSKGILEIGCGLGNISYYIAQNTSMQVTGTDICVPFIEEARETYILPNLDFQVLDFNEVADFDGKKYDYIIGNGILHHLYFHLDKALENLHSLLTENGKIIFYEPNIYNPYCAVIFNIPYFRKLANLEPAEMAFSKPYISKKLFSAGFSQIKVSFLDFLLPGIPDIFIKPSVAVGNVMEKIYPLNRLAQSLFIVAGR